MRKIQESSSVGGQALFWAQPLPTQSGKSTEADTGRQQSSAPSIFVIYFYNNKILDCHTCTLGVREYCPPSKVRKRLSIWWFLGRFASCYETYCFTWFLVHFLNLKHIIDRVIHWYAVTKCTTSVQSTAHILRSFVLCMHIRSSCCHTKLLFRWMVITLTVSK